MGVCNARHVLNLVFKGEFMPKNRSRFTDILEIDVQEDEICKPPRHDGAEFVCGALKASEKAPLRERKVIQTDVADTLNCAEESLSFLWTQPVKGAEILDCEIPDFREVSQNPALLSLAAE